MKTVSMDAFEADTSALLKEVVLGKSVLRVLTGQDENLIVLTQADYDSLVENLQVREEPGSFNWISRSLRRRHKELDS